MAGKRQKANLALVDREKKYTLADALEILSKFQGPKFDETVNIAVRLGVDVKQADQQVR